MELTRNPKALAQILKHHTEAEESKLSWRRVSWLLALYYMAGARVFDVIDIRSGEVRYSYTDDEEKLEFQSPELLSAVDKVSGQLASANLSPWVRRQDSYSLSAIRERAIGQIVADSMVSRQQLEEITPQFAYLFSLLGSCGITGRVFDHPTIGLTGDLEIIHPQELFPFPSVGTDFTKVGGIVRQRMVPIPLLRKLLGTRKINNAMRDNTLEWWGQDAWLPSDGDDASIYPFAGSYKLAEGGVPTASDSFDSNEVEMAYAKIKELWLYGPRQTCARYIVTSGDVTLVDQDLEGQEVYCRIGFARFMNNGTFHGAGVFDLLFPLARQAEKMEAALYKNIQDIAS